jgi:NADH-quinone oxidoreductase subunit J
MLCFVFSILKTLVILNASLVILAKNPVHSVLYLVSVFLASSFLIICLEADFMALILIVVYVGAIAVLFLFICMMLNIRLDNSETGGVHTYMPLSGIFGVIFILELSLALYNSFNNTYINDDVLDFKALFFRVSNIRVIGDVLYTYYYVYFILASVILLLAMIGAISLTLHHRLDVKRQVIYVQVAREYLLSRYL